MSGLRSVGTVSAEETRYDRFTENWSAPDHDLKRHGLCLVGNRYILTGSGALGTPVEHLKERYRIRYVRRKEWAYPTPLSIGNIYSPSVVEVHEDRRIPRQCYRYPQPRSSYYM